MKQNYSYLFSARNLKLIYCNTFYGWICYLYLRSFKSEAKLTSPESKITAAGGTCRSANLLKACRSFSSAAFLHIDATCTRSIWAAFNSWIICNKQQILSSATIVGYALCLKLTWLCSLVTSHTTTNSSSLNPWKNCSRISCTTVRAETPLGTWQFSMSQKTPIGGFTADVVGADELSCVSKRKQLDFKKKYHFNLTTVPCKRSIKLLSCILTTGLIRWKSPVFGKAATNCCSLDTGNQIPASWPCTSIGPDKFLTSWFFMPIVTEIIRKTIRVMQQLFPWHCWICAQCITRHDLADACVKVTYLVYCLLGCSSWLKSSKSVLAHVKGKNLEEKNFDHITDFTR